MYTIEKIHKTTIITIYNMYRTIPYGKNPLMQKKRRKRKNKNKLSFCGTRGV